MLAVFFIVAQLTSSLLANDAKLFRNLVHTELSEMPDTFYRLIRSRSSQMYDEIFSALDDRATPSYLYSDFFGNLYAQMEQGLFLPNIDKGIADNWLSNIPVQTNHSLLLDELHKAMASVEHSMGSMNEKIDILLSENSCYSISTSPGNGTRIPEMEKIMNENGDRIANCAEGLKNGYTHDGVYLIQPVADGPFQSVWCNQSWEGGGWTVILHRQEQKKQLDFRRKMKHYEKGFGEAHQEFWIGLETLANLTADRKQELAVTISIPEENAYSLYSEFWIANEEGRKLHVGGYDDDSTAGDSLSYHSGMEFSTYDHDKDRNPELSCSSQAGGGGFWFNVCYHANPTGVYPPRGLPENTALHSMLEWRRWQGFYTFLSQLTMMIRPRK